MHGHRPSDPHGTERRSGRQEGARILDLTSRLPEDRRVQTPEPDHPSFFIHRLLILLAFLIGLGVGMWLRETPKSTLGERSAQSLIQSLSSPERLIVPWPDQDYRPLRLITLEERVQPGSATQASLSLKEERAGELHLLDAAQERRDAKALRALGMLHILRAEDVRTKALASEEIRELLERYGPSAAVLNDLAVLSALKNQPPESLRLLEEAMERASDNPILYYNAAQVSRAIHPEGSSQEETYLLRYLKTDPGSPWRNALQERLETISVPVVEGRNVPVLD